MNQFTLERGLRTTLLIMIAIGVVSMVITYIGDDEIHTRFWSNFLHNSLFFTGLAIMALFFIGVKITAWAGWQTVFKRVWESFSLFLIPGLILMLIIAAGIWGGWHHLYHWADADSVASDKLLQHKSSFLNPTWFTMATIIIGGLWVLLATRIRRLSLDEDVNGDSSFWHVRRMRIWAAATLPAIGFGSAVLIWLWVMSVDAHWYSTLFAWYNAASWFVAMLALTTLILYYLKSRGYYQQVSIEHIHDLGKWTFAFTIFWAYLWFSQYMLIWYANIGEETIYFRQRVDEYPVLFYGNLIINFVFPFFILIRNDTKRKLGSMIFIALVVFVGHWMDFFLMLKPGILHTAQEIAGAGEHAHGATAGFTFPGFLEFGTMIGFLGFFLYFSFTRLSKAALIPRNDPYLGESVQHHV